MNHGDYLPFQADTPISQAIDALEQRIGRQERYQIDARHDGQWILLRPHRTDYAYLADVPRERVAKLLRLQLSPRETEIAALLFEGNTIRYIAAALHIAEGTVKRIIHNIYQKMHVGSQVELVREIYARLARM